MHFCICTGEGLHRQGSSFVLQLWVPCVAGGAEIPVPSQQSSVPWWLAMKEQKEESIYCAMEAKQLWLYFSIVLHGNQLDEGIITYQARGILSAFP